MPNAPSATDPPKVFAYRDYREFLRDYYLHHKQASNLSYRGFSRRVKIKSPNYLKLVIEGQRNLSDAMSKRFAAACKLDTNA